MKNFADPHDIGQKGLESVSEQGYFLPLENVFFFSPILSNFVFYYATSPLFAMQSAKENITLGVLMGMCTCGL